MRTRRRRRRCSRAAATRGSTCSTAPTCTARGRSEEILGRCVAGCRDEVVLTTKAYFPTSDDGNARGASRYHLVRAVEASLRRLGTDRIDLFFLHRFDDRTAARGDPAGRSRTWCSRARSCIRRSATSRRGRPRAPWAWPNAIAGRRSSRMQPMYNLVKRQAEVELLPLAARRRARRADLQPAGRRAAHRQVRARARAPSSGRLVDEHDVRDALRRCRRNFAIAERFTALARELGHHPASLAIAWVAAHPAVTAPILGARNSSSSSRAWPPGRSD